MFHRFGSILLCLFLAVPVFATVPRPATVPEEVLKSSVCVQIDLGGGRFGCGSGTVVRVKDGKVTVLTCKHVIPHSGRITVWFNSGSVSKAPQRAEGKFLAADAESDLSLVETEAIAGVPPVALSLLDVSHGKSVWQAGYPGMKLTQRWGAILKDQSWCGVTPNVHIGLTVQPGDSGSGIFTGDSELCGVVWGGSHGKTYATGVPGIRRFVRSTLGDE